MKRFRLLVTRKMSVPAAGKIVGSRLSIVQKEFITIVPIQSADLQKKIAGLCKEKETVVFTSKHAVAAVAVYAEQASPSWKIFCTNGQTQQQVLLAFTKSRMAGTAENAEKLAGEILKESSLHRIVFFCGNKRREELPAVLSAKGIRVEEVMVYETTLTPEKMTGAFEGISFFSPSAVESFFSLNRLLAHTVCFSIGATTTATVQRFTKNPVLTAEKPTEESMLALINDYVKKYNE